MHGMRIGKGGDHGRDDQGLMHAHEITKRARDIESCIICLDAISEPAIALPCRHQTFDFLCLVSWLQEKPNCPLCKTEIHHVEYDRRSPEDFQVYKIALSPNQVAKDSPNPTQPITSTFNRSEPRSSLRPWRTRAYPRPGADSAILRRRYIYRSRLYSLHVGTNRLSRFRDLTTQTFRHDEELVSRARKWIRRELQVFEFLNSEENKEGVGRRAQNAEFLLEYIIAILKTVDIKGSCGQAEDMLQEFLGRDNTRLFLHELKAWLRSPYVSLEDWDRHVQYKDDAVSGSRSVKRQTVAHPLHDCFATKRRLSIDQNTRSPVRKIVP